jgi:hypothetical protein
MNQELVNLIKKDFESIKSEITKEHNKLLIVKIVYKIF